MFTSADGPWRPRTADWQHDQPRSQFSRSNSTSYLMCLHLSACHSVLLCPQSPLSRAAYWLAVCRSVATITPDRQLSSSISDGTWHPVRTLHQGQWPGWDRCRFRINAHCCCGWNRTQRPPASFVFAVDNEIRVIKSKRETSVNLQCLIGWTWWCSFD